MWSDPKRAQELGREKKSLEAVVATLGRVDSGLADSAELFELARGDKDDATLEEVHRIPDLVTPTGKFNVYNTVHDVY